MPNWSEGMRKLITIALFVPLVASSQVNLDSLWGVWGDETQADTSRLNAMQEIAWKGFLFSQPDSAFTLAEVQYSFAESIENKKWMALAMNTQGVSYAVRRKTDEAVQCFEQAGRLYEEIEDLEGVGAALNNIGNIHVNTGQYEKALEVFNQSMEIREQINDTYGIASCYNNIGNIYTHQGDIISALGVFTKCLRLAEQMDDKVLIATSLNNIGNLYRIQEDYEASLESTKRALEMYITLGDLSNAVRVNSVIGLTYKNMGDYPKALEYQQKCVELSQQISDPMETAAALSNISGVYILMTETLGVAPAYVDSLLALALESELRSLQLSEEVNYRDAIAGSKGNLCIIYFKKGDFAQSILFGREAIEIAQQEGVLHVIRDVAHTLFQIYQATGNADKALENHLLYVELRDSILNNNNQKAIIQNQYENAYEKQALADSLDYLKKQEMEQLAHQAELQHEANQRYILYGGLGFLLLLGGIAFRGYQRKKRDNRIIVKQKQDVELQRDLIEEKNKEIVDSINYARRLQEAILPPRRVVKEYLQQSFILYKPKDIVAGDFYWMETIDDLVLIAAADCTGHGVPGAMVSVVCSNALNKAVNELGYTDPGKVLDIARELVVQRFTKSEDQVKDGMDVALCAFNTKTGALKYAGANNPLWIIRKGAAEVEEVKATKQPVGLTHDPVPFKSHSTTLSPGDTFYIFSDGYVDQFGGERGKKFKARAFRELLLSIQVEDMGQQHDHINDAFETWRGELEQVDDVCVIGVRV